MQLTYIHLNLCALPLTIKKNSLHFPPGVKVGKTDWSPALGGLEGLGGGDQVEDEVQV